MTACTLALPRQRPVGCARGMRRSPRWAAKSPWTAQLRGTMPLLKRRHAPPQRCRLTSASSRCSSVTACSTARRAAGRCTPSAAATLVAKPLHRSAACVSCTRLDRYSAVVAACTRHAAASRRFSSSCASRLGSWGPRLGAGSWAGGRGGQRGGGAHRVHAESAASGGGSGEPVRLAAAASQLLAQRRAGCSAAPDPRTQHPTQDGPTPQLAAGWRAAARRSPTTACPPAVAAHPPGQASP